MVSIQLFWFILACILDTDRYHDVSNREHSGEPPGYASSELAEPASTIGPPPPATNYSCQAFIEPGRAEQTIRVTGRFPFNEPVLPALVGPGQPMLRGATAS